VRHLINSYRNNKLEEIFDENYLKVRSVEKVDDHIKAANDIFMQFVSKHTVDSLYRFYSDFIKKRGDNIVESIPFIE
jgi:hypothetical protein